MLNIIEFFGATAMAASALTMTVMEIDIVKNWRR